MTTRALSACVFLAALGIPACSKEAPEEVESETVVSVTAAPAQTGTITAVVTAAGIVSPAPGAELIVIAPEAARIVEMPKAEGDEVHKGDLLVRFEIPSAVADVSKQRTEITRAQARLENARAAQARARDLFDRGVGARREMEEAARETADAEADLASAQAGAVAADTVAARSVVQAAFDGVVARRAHNPGDFVEPTAADAVLRVLDPRRLEVTALVPVADVSRVRLGAPAHIVEAEGTPRVSLAVAARPIAVQPGTATVPVRLAFRGAHQYPVGAPLTVEIDAESHGRAVLVPASAVVREGADTAVFVAAGSKAQRRTVTTGIETSQLAEIKSGLKAGEVVITSGQNGLPDGADITLAKPGGDGADEKPAEDAGGRGAAEKK